MAHVMKIKATSVSPLIDHYERARPGTFDRSNIDESRTRMNYNLAPADVKEDVRSAIAEHAKTAGRAVRSDANVLFDWVVTMPKDCPLESAREFFRGTLEFLKQRYGADNVLGGYVHMDETTPHMHVPVLPRIDGKLQASKMINRNDLRSFHNDLGKYIDERLGFHVSVELDEEKHIEKAMNKLDQEEMKLAAARLECLQRGESEARERISDLERDVAIERNRVRAEEYAKAAFEGRDSTGLLESEAREYENLARNYEQRRNQIKERVRELKEQIIGMRARISEVLRGDVSNISKEFVRSLRHKLELNRLRSIGDKLERERPRVRIQEKGLSR